MWELVMQLINQLINQTQVMLEDSVLRSSLVIIVRHYQDQDQLNLCTYPTAENSEASS